MKIALKTLVATLMVGAAIFGVQAAANAGHGHGFSGGNSGGYGQSYGGFSHGGSQYGGSQYGGMMGPSFGGGYGCQPRPPVWHNTSHYDFHPGQYVQHGNHSHYVPGHYDFHQTGHWDR